MLEGLVFYGIKKKFIRIKKLKSNKIQFPITRYSNFMEIFSYMLYNRCYIRLQSCW